MVSCAICQAELRAITWKHLKYKHGMTVKEYDVLYPGQPHGVTGNTPESVAKASATRAANPIVPWNKGLTKETHASIRRYAESRMGAANPVHKIADREAWIAAVREGNAEHYTQRRGKTLEEVYGAEHATTIKASLSRGAKKRTIHGHTGRKHTQDTKNRLREITANRIAKQRCFVSKPQRALFDALSAREPDKWALEHVVGFYSIDIADQDRKIAIEVDGDFWHCNTDIGYAPLFECQKRNLANDKSKTSYLVGRGWKLIRVWTSDIDADINKTVTRITGLLNDK